MPATTRHIELDGRELPLTGPVTRIGRSLTADIELEDLSVSRRHALIVVEGDAVHLLDEGSRNGTWLNGHRVRRSLLRDGDTIVLGTAQLRYAENALTAV
jgi:pSer/pThr/pTyr-binding forkhead associated (FHA) protein